MNDPSLERDPDLMTPDREKERLPRGATAIAWFLIIAAISALLLIKAFTPAEAGSDREDPLGLTVLKLQARMLVGLHASGFDTSNQVVGTLESLNTGTIGQRLRVSAASAEVKGPQAGLDVLKQLNDAVGKQTAIEFTEDELTTIQLLQTLYTTDAGNEPVGRVLPPDQRTFLRDQLDWFGDLALVRIDETPEANTASAGMASMPTRDEVLTPAVRFATILMVGIFFGFGALLIGFIVLITLIVMSFLGKTRSGMRLDGPHYGVYAETFFVWFILFFGLNEAAGFLPWGLGGSVLAFFTSLLALIYPVLRGIPWRRVRQDIGWTLGRNPVLEPLLGPLGYAICLPLLTGGLLMSFILMVFTSALSPAHDADSYLGPTAGPAHPIVQLIEQGDVLGILLVFTVASIAAPIVEETFFRGVLYAHLRGVSRNAAAWISIIFAMLVSAFIFAVIHPQGYIAVPALMSLAIGMAIMREWRGTLIPSMLIHGISNGIVMSIVTLALVG